MKKNILFAVLFSLLWAGISEGKNLSEVFVVSSERGTDGVYGIYFISKNSEGWSPRVTISVNDQQQIHPTLMRNNDNGDMMLAWTRFSGSNGRIYSRFFSSVENVWYPVQSLSTETTSDMWPSLAMDEFGTIWLAFSGSESSGDDIYVSRWTGKGWSAPAMVNRKDNSPDVKPAFEYSASGRLRLVWKGFSEGGYVNFGSDLLNGQWSVEQQLAANRQNRAVSVKKQSNLGDAYMKLPIGSQAAIIDSRESQSLAIPVVVGE